MNLGTKSNPTNASVFRSQRAAVNHALHSPNKRVCVVKLGSRFQVNYGSLAKKLAKLPGAKMIYKDGF